LQKDISLLTEIKTLHANVLAEVKSELEKAPKGEPFNNFLKEYKRLKENSAVYRDELKTTLKN
jgi:hypothetical protein